MSLASPPWLLGALALMVVLVLLWRATDRRRRAALQRFAALQLLADLTAELSLRRRAVKRALLLAAIGLAGLALAGPQRGFTWEETQRRGIDVLIALDTSRSMLAQDVAPNRLERAKLAITDLVDMLGSDRVGLIAFAGSAFLQCPLTLDHGAFLEALHALRPGVIPAPGSDLASALQTAEEALQSEQRNVKLLVLFSDGEDLGGGALEAARRAAEQGIRVFTVGVGSSTGELIPLPGDGGGTSFLKDPEGQFVKSRLDADTLRQVAETTGGFYEPLGRRGEAVAAIYERALAPLPKEELASRMRRVPIDRFQWPLALTLLCLAVELVVGERRGRGAKTAAGMSGVVLLALAGGAYAASPQEAARLYGAGEYDKALAEYRAAAADAGENPRLDFNLGAAAYKAGELGDAAAAFARALRSDDPQLQEQGFYNLGNTQFRIGQQTAQSDPQQTVQAWQQALDAYQSALEVDPADEDALFNRDFVKRALEELQQEQQQQDDQDQQQDQDENKEQQEKQQQADQQQQQQPQEGDQQQSNEQQARQDQPDDSKEGASQDEREDEQQAKAQPQEGDAKPQDERDGAPEARNQPPPDGGEQTARAPKPQGQMSPAEAKELLDSLKDGEATMQELQANQPRPRTPEAERDW